MNEVPPEPRRSRAVPGQGSCLSWALPRAGQRARHPEPVWSPRSSPAGGVSEPGLGAGPGPGRECRGMRRLEQGVSEAIRGSRQGEAHSPITEKLCSEEATCIQLLVFSKMTHVLILFSSLESFRLCHRAVRSYRFRVPFFPLEGWVRLILRCLCPLLFSSRLPCVVFVFCLLGFEAQFSKYKITHYIPSLTLRKPAHFPRG